MITTLPVYRRSALQLVSEGCLKRFKDIYLDGVEDHSDLAWIGTGGHAVKYAYIQRLLAKQLPADGEEADEAFIEGISDAQIPARLIPQIREPWMRHVENWELQLDRYVAAEEPQITGQVGFTPDLVLAHADRGNELEIIDSKWGWDPPMTEAELRGLFQARVYSLYAKEAWPGFSSIRFTIEAIRFNKYVSVVFSVAELDQVELEVRAAIATIEHAAETNHYPPMAGPSCRFCQLACPIADQQLTLPPRLLAPQAAMAAAWLLPADRQVRAVKKALKAYVAGHGPVSVNGIVWDNRKTTNRSYLARAVVQRLETRGITRTDPTTPYVDDLAFSHSSLKPFFKRYGEEFEQELAGSVQTKDSWRFSARQAGQDDEDGDDE